MTADRDDMPLDAAQARALLDRLERDGHERVTPADEADEDYLDPSHEGGLDPEFLAPEQAPSAADDDDFDDPSHSGGLDPDWH